MTMMLRKIVLAAVLWFGASGLVYAIPVTYNFTATGFTEQGSLGIAAPTDPVSGSFTIDGSTLNALNLTIDSHTYSLSEVGFNPNFGLNGEFLLGATLDTINVIQWGANDFWLEGTLGANPQFSNFAYSVSGTNDMWSTYTGTISLPGSGPGPGPGSGPGCHNHKHKHEYDHDHEYEHDDEYEHEHEYNKVPEPASLGLLGIGLIGLGITRKRKIKTRGE